MNVLSRTMATLLASTLATLMDSGFIRLYTGALPITPDTPLASFVAQEATFGGYPVGGIAVPTPLLTYNDPNGGVTFMVPGVTFVATTAVTPNTITGWFVTNVGSTELVLAGEFPSPFDMNQEGDGLPLSLGVTIGQAEGIIANTNYAE
jgi:hypothetical protein